MSLNTSERVWTTLGIVVAMVMTGLLMFGSLKFTKGLVEANADRTFMAAVTDVRTILRHKPDCPQLNELGKTENLIEIQLDREVQIWSENGTGNGDWYPTKVVDLVLKDATNREMIDEIQARALVSNGPVIFHYGVSFLSICDLERIPIIASFATKS